MHNFIRSWEKTSADTVISVERLSWFGLKTRKTRYIYQDGRAPKKAKLRRSKWTWLSYTMLAICVVLLSSTLLTILL